MSSALPRGYKNVDQLLHLLQEKSSTFWEAQGRRRVIKLAEEMRINVPAYKKFLKTHKRGKDPIKSKKKFLSLPLLDKDSYLRNYPLNELCWEGKFDTRSWVISTTSGSTGEPFYFPREDEQDQQYSVLAELYMRTNFNIENKSSLYIDAFPMGPWIGGVFTYEAVRKVAERGDYNLSIITTGVNKDEIIKAVNKFGSLFDQVIIGCYGPFLKDALDEGVRKGVNWKNYDLKFVFSAEGFTEKFREYVLNVAGSKNYFTDTLNHYGIVDLGTTSYETPISILLRCIALSNKNLYADLFGETNKLPTLAQYIPALHYFEDIEGRLVCSSYSGLPLVRYDVKDNGGVMKFDDVEKICSQHGVDLMKEAEQAGIKETVWKLPFVYVYERSDFSVSLYAFQIYPETIRKALLDDAILRYVTGKFTMQVKFDKIHNQYLEINVELQGGVKGSVTLQNRIHDVIISYLRKYNSEYDKTYLEIPERVTPDIILWSYEDEKYFKPGIKQKWTQKK